MNIRQIWLSSSKYSLKSPYAMVPIGICVHNTANNASAYNEVSYMCRNESSTSFHVAVDDKEIIQAIPYNRNAWHCGNTTGNRNTIGLEICYSTGDEEKFLKAEDLACEYIAELCKKYGWNTDDLYTHNMWSGKNCLPVDTTEVLTPGGWEFLKNIKKGDEVCTYIFGKNKFKWDNVIAKTGEFKNKTIEARGLEATLNHNMLYHSVSCNADKQLCYIDLFNKNRDFKIPACSEMEQFGLDLTDDEIRYLVWVQADGHYSKRKYKDTYKYIGIEFHLSKQRKKQRLTDLLNRLHITYTCNERSDKTACIRIHSGMAVLDVERWLCDKCYSYLWLNMNKHQYKVFKEELLHTDGSFSNNGYCSSVESNLDIVQAIATLNNDRTHKCQTGTSRQLLFSDKQNYYFSPNKSKVTERVTIVDCITVPSGYILIRQNGKCFITGNCPHKTLELGWERFVDKVNSYLHGDIEYVIKYGDTLWSISKKFGCSIDSIVEHNSISNPDLIRSGTVIKIPV